MIDKVIEIIFNQLVKYKSYNILGLGTFYIKPARRGLSYTRHGVSETKFKWRVSFKVSRLFKDRVNSFLK